MHSGNEHTLCASPGDNQLVFPGYTPVQPQAFPFETSAAPLVHSISLYHYPDDMNSEYVLVM